MLNTNNIILYINGLVRVRMKMIYGKDDSRKGYWQSNAKKFIKQRKVAAD